MDQAKPATLMPRTFSPAVVMWFRPSIARSFQFFLKDPEIWIFQSGFLHELLGLNVNKIKEMLTPLSDYFQFVARAKFSVQSFFNRCHVKLGFKYLFVLMDLAQNTLSSPQQQYRKGPPTALGSEDTFSVWFLRI